MPEILAQALALPGLGWIVFGAALGGLVRGFTGFGAALVFLPLAAMVVPPVTALAALTIMDIFGPLPNLRRAWGDAARPDLARMVGALLLSLPLGVALLLVLPEEVFRWAVSLTAAGAALLLMAGWRFRGVPGPAQLVGAGGLGGVMGGAVGLPGPPVILLYLSSQAPAREVRANIMLYLYAFDLGLLGLLGLSGRLDAATLVLGLLIAPVAMLGNIAGAALFDEDRAALYRWIGVAVVLAAALRGLPLWN